MFYTVYRITNKINGKTYHGMHKTKNLDDGYMGSGKVIRRAIEKHGLKNFQKDILFVFDSKQEMELKEAEIVNPEYLASGTTYNLKEGGLGGFDFVNEKGLSVRHFSKENAKAYNKLGYDKVNGDPLLSEKRMQNALAALAVAHVTNPKPFEGKLHSVSSRQKMSEKAKERTTSFQLGSVWISNGSESKIVTRDEPIPTGWALGRNLKKCGVCSSFLKKNKAGQIVRCPCIPKPKRKSPASTLSYPFARGPYEVPQGQGQRRYRISWSRGVVTTCAESDLQKVLDSNPEIFLKARKV